VPNDNKEATEIEAIKASFVDADEAGWLHQDLDSYMDAWADDARLIIARGEDSGPYDVTSDRQTIQAVHKMVFQAIFGAGLRIDYKKLDVALAGETATIKRSTVVRFSGGYETWGGIVDMRKDAGGWKAFKSRSWIVNKKQGQDLTTFDADTWKRLDAEVEKRRVEGDLHKLAQAFFDAYRFAEAHQVAKELTSKTDSPASDWTLRGSFALRAGDPSDAIAAFKKALSLDPNAPIPPYDELIVAAPPSLQLTGVDLPADREGSVRSLSSDASAELFVHNGTPYTLDIYWLNFQGQREGRNRVPPGTTWSSSTFLTHPFLVCDTNGRSLGILETKERSRTVSLAATGGKQPPKNAKK
jgi:hypothetical protein